MLFFKSKKAKLVEAIIIVLNRHKEEIYSKDGVYHVDCCCDLCVLLRALEDAGERYYL